MVDQHRIATWKAAFSSSTFMIMLAIVVILGAVLVNCLPHFLLYKESVDGVRLSDPIISRFAPLDFNPYIFYVTTLCIIVGKISSILTPRGLLAMTTTLLTLNVLRVAVLYLIDLDAPADIIPLYDPFLEYAFYKDVLITKDLFFSGHTSNIIVFAFLTQISWMRGFFLASALFVGSMLVLQHVHYTIDVLAAPFFAYGTYRVIDLLLDKLEGQLFTTCHTGEQAKAPLGYQS